MPAFTFTVVLLVLMPAVYFQIALAFHYYIGVIIPCNDSSYNPRRCDAVIGLALHTLAYLLAGPRLLFALLP